MAYKLIWKNEIIEEERKIKVEVEPQKDEKSNFCSQIHTKELLRKDLMKTQNRRIKTLKSEYKKLNDKWVDVKTQITLRVE